MTEDAHSRFIDGQKVTSLHLQHLQDRLREGIADIRSNIGLGKVAWGLKAELADSEVTVYPGAAFSHSGSRLSIAEEAQVSVPDGDGPWQLVIRGENEDIEALRHNGASTVINLIAQLLIEPVADVDIDTLILATIDTVDDAPQLQQDPEIFATTGHHNHTGTWRQNALGQWAYDGPTISSDQPNLPGPRGEQGPVGPMGPQGPQGEAGTDGTQGSQGETGPQGIQGLKGDKGDPGAQGETGAQGQQGEIGPEGIPGDQGEQGLEGVQGLTGAVGQRGPAGARGERGEVGVRGEAGPQGEVGPPGSQGEAGETGENGPIGAQGNRGAQGEPGSQGDQGIQGIQGEQGDVGRQGDTGEAGPIGVQGIQGELGEKGEPGEIGQPGAQGVEGEPGPEGDRGSQGVPGPVGQQGDPGDIGPIGIQGIQGEPGETGPVGATGSQGLRGLNGDRGPVGAQGSVGNTGAQGETGTTGAAGSKGEQGVTGARGQRGATGPRGEPGSGFDPDWPKVIAINWPHDKEVVLENALGLIKNLRLSMSSAASTTTLELQPQVIQVIFEAGVNDGQQPTVPLQVLKGNTRIDGPEIIWFGPRNVDDLAKIIGSNEGGRGRLWIRVSCGGVLDEKNRPLSSSPGVLYGLDIVGAPGGVLESWFYVGRG